MGQTKVVPMVEGGILAAVSIIFAFISVYIPLIGAFVNMIWPVPIILLGVRHGYKWSIMATVVSGLLIAMMVHPLQAISVVVGFGLIGIALGYALHAQYSAGKTLLYGSIASFVSKIAVIGIGLAITGVNPIDFQASTMSATIAQIMDFYRGMGMSEEDLTKMEQSVTGMIDIIKIILPAGFLLAAISDTALNFWVAKIVLKKLGHTVKPFPPFKEWNLPRAILWFFAIAVVMVYVGRTQNQQLVYNIGMNLQVIVSVVLLVQGLALFYYLADKYKWSKLARGILLFMIFTNGIFTQVIIFAGAFDVAFDYRKLRVPRQS